MFDVLAVVYAGRSVNHAINEGALAKGAGNRTQQSTARVNSIQRSARGCTFCAFACSYFVTLWALVGLSAFLSAYLIRGVALGEGFGVPAIASALITKLAVSATPMVPCRLDVVFVNEEHSRWLRHSDAYGNPDVITEILNWMRVGSPSLERDVVHTGRSTGPAAEPLL